MRASASIPVRGIILDVPAGQTTSRSEHPPTVSSPRASVLRVLLVSSLDTRCGKLTRRTASRVACMLSISEQVIAGDHVRASCTTLPRAPTYFQHILRAYVLNAPTWASSIGICWTTSACWRLSTTFDFDMAFFKVLSDASMRGEHDDNAQFTIRTRWTDDS